MDASSAKRNRRFRMLKLVAAAVGGLAVSAVLAVAAWRLSHDLVVVFAAVGVLLSLYACAMVLVRQLSRLVVINGRLKRLQRVLGEPNGHASIGRAMDGLADEADQRTCDLVSALDALTARVDSLEGRVAVNLATGLAGSQERSGSAIVRSE